MIPLVQEFTHREIKFHREAHARARAMARMMRGGRGGRPNYPAKLTRSEKRTVGRSERPSPEKAHTERTGKRRCSGGTDDECGNTDFSTSDGRRSHLHSAAAAAGHIFWQKLFLRPYRLLISSPSGRVQTRRFLRDLLGWIFGGNRVLHPTLLKNPGWKNPAKRTRMKTV